MTTYVDNSALLKRYVEEPDSEVADQYISADPILVTARHTIVEVRRNLARLLDGVALDEARQTFEEDLSAFAIVELDEVTCEIAATIAEHTGARSRDALHLAAMQRAGGAALTLLTFDAGQARIARDLGYVVVGV